MERERIYQTAKEDTKALAGDTLASPDTVSPRTLHSAIVHRSTLSSDFAALYCTTICHIMSTPDPSQAFSEREYYAKTPEIYFSDRTNTLLVGANPLLYPAHQETSQDVTGMQKSSNADGPYEISREDMIGLIGNAWMTLDDEAKGRVRRHLRDTVDNFAFDIGKAMESFANDPEGRQTEYLEPDCELDCMTIPKPKLDPQFLPDWDNTEPWYRKKPIISFTHQDGQLTHVNFAILAPVEGKVIPDYTANVTYPLPSHQVIPTRKCWEYIVDATLLPMARHCASELSDYINDPENSAKKQAFDNKFTAFPNSLMIRFFQGEATVNDFNAAPALDQSAGKDLSCVSQWAFEIAGNPIRLRASALSRKEFDAERARVDSLQGLDNEELPLEYSSGFSL